MEKYIDKPWDWKKMSKEMSKQMRGRSRDIRWSFIDKYIDKDWDWYALTENMFAPLISTSTPFELEKYINKPLDWDLISSWLRCHYIARKFYENNFIEKYIDKPWNISILKDNDVGFRFSINSNIIYLLNKDLINKLVLVKIIKKLIYFIKSRIFDNFKNNYFITINNKSKLLRIFKFNPPFRYGRAHRDRLYKLFLSPALRISFRYSKTRYRESPLSNLTYLSKSILNKLIILKISKIIYRYKLHFVIEIIKFNYNKQLYIK